jgi:hypothetical protein
MKNYGLTSIHEFLGDRLVYRNLSPLDPALPSLSDIRRLVGLPEGSTPRKSSPEYARAVVEFLRYARRLDAPDASIKRLIYLGDTRMNDGTAFANLCRAGNWPGLAFIGDEKGEPAPLMITEWEGQTLCLANYWAALYELDAVARQRGFALDEHTALVIDLDKTALGARGRNDHVIDRARVLALQQTVEGALGDTFDPETFRAAYDRLNRPEYHPFTADNQDYLAYICLILGSGQYSLETLETEVKSGRLTTFAQFIARVDSQADSLPASLRDIHASVYQYVLWGDPTPFKTFRYNEYCATVEKMGYLGENVPAQELIKEELVITQEVRWLASEWQAQGVLLFGLSDKPDEAALPPPDLAAQGYVPIHRVQTHTVGE